MHVLIMSRTLFRMNPHSIIAWMSRNSWSLSNCNVTRIHNHLVHKRTLNHLAKLTLRIKWLWVRVPWQSLKLMSSIHFFWNFAIKKSFSLSISLYSFISIGCNFVNHSHYFLKEIGVGKINVIKSFVTWEV